MTDYDYIDVEPSYRISGRVYINLNGTNEVWLTPDEANALAQRITTAAKEAWEKEHGEVNT
jgi:hypothetical protein